MTGMTSVPQKEIEKAPKLVLTVCESHTYKPKTEFLINACGYTGSKRKANDGYVYIGAKEVNSETGEILNDIVFPAGERGMGNRHVLIMYEMERKAYYIKDLCEGTGTFIHIDKPLLLQHGYIISYGDSHMFVSIFSDNGIQLKYLDGPRVDETLYFSSLSLTLSASTFKPSDGVIRIGRTEDCNIVIRSEALSRCQCCVYMGKSGWTIADGDGTKSSRNGTW